MSERPRVSQQHNVNNLMRRVLNNVPIPTELQFEDPDGVGIPYATTLRGKYWKLARAKIAYLNGQNGMLKDKFEDIVIDGDVEFALSIQGGVQEYMDSVALTTIEPFPERLDLKSMYRRIKTPKSHFWVAGLYDTLESYLTRKSFDETEPDKEAISFYFKHLKMYEYGIKILEKLDEEEQQSKLLEGIITGTSAGWDLWIHQSKSKFPGQFRKYTLSSLEREFPFTVNGILDCVSYALSQKHFPPFTLFYRTQGGTKKKVRAVFGGNMLAKAVGALLHAAKQLGKSKLLYFGKVPWIAWDSWDPMFKLHNTQVEHYMSLIDKGKDVDVFGEDFTGWDQSLHEVQFRFLFDYSGTMSDILRWTHGLLKYSDVWTGGYKVRGIQFKSGHPLTSELGSFKHLELDLSSAKHNGFKIDHATFLSDDNLTYVRNFDFDSHSEYLKSRGHDISLEKVTSLQRTRYVEFLKVLMGNIFSDEGSQFVGNPLSRYPGLAHLERLGEVREVWNVTDGKDIPVDQVLSKLSSYGYYATPWVETILRIVRDTPLGKRVINELIAFKHKDIPTSAYRPDLSLGFHPEWLKELDLSQVRRV